MRRSGRRCEFARPAPASAIARSSKPLRRDLGFDLLEGIWARNDMPEDEAMGLALEAQDGVAGTEGA